MTSQGQRKKNKGAKKVQSDKIAHQIFNTTKPNKPRQIQT